MPNPLSMVMSPPTTAAKPDATAQEQRVLKGADSFQTVMDQETGQQSGELETADPQVLEPDTGSEIEEVEPAEISVASEDQPTPEVRAVKQDVAQEPPAEKRVELPPTMPPSIQKDKEPVSDARPDAPRIEDSQHLEKRGQRAATPTLQTLVMGSAQPTRTPEAVSKPKDTLAVLETAETRPKEMPDLAASFGPGRDVPHILPAPNLPSPQPTLPDRAPTFVQMQLLASEQSSAQTETSVVPDIEDAQAVRDVPTSSAARDSGPTVQSMTATARAETARAIAGQMASVISTRPQSGAIEIALNPEELGRVSIILNGRDDGLHMTIVAERPETLDMMRRHLSVLESEFQDLGLGDLSFDLGTSSNAPQDDSETDTGPRYSTPGAEHVAKDGPALPQLSPEGRIDMRL